MIVEIEKIVHGGYGLTHSGNSVILVPLSVPGDIVDIEFAEGEGISFGWIKSIIKPSIYRKDPCCPVFGLCGGCDFDNMEYPYELTIKEGILREDLSRIAKMKVTDIDRVIGSSEYGYRNHARFKVSVEGEVGFFMKKSHEVVPLPDEGCRLLHRDINEFLKKIRRTGEFRAGGFRIRTDTMGNIFQKGVHGLKDNTFCYQYVNKLKYRLKIDDFFQVNNSVTAQWLNIIESYLNLESNDIVVDLFSGSGLIILTIAKKVKSVTGIEINRNAVNNARYNAGWNNVSNVSFIRANAAKGLNLLAGVNKIVVDPPRSGLTENIIGAVVTLAPSVIVYASCDTATFSRDLKRFSEMGYHLKEVSLIDMFPRTKHSEVVARIERN
ncbi:MAG: class I SAM-dependent RNA methyltransferase [Spirochaetes bacterium]|nr:class I SAM-dependent RNA methyltransferase [Spirochaetota bacterium]